MGSSLRVSERHERLKEVPHGLRYFSMTDKRSKIILINGASSAGKSTLAKAFQALVDEPFLHFSLDLMMFGGEVLPARRDTAGPFSWASMRPMLFEGYYRCLAALASAGNNIVADYIIETQDQLDRLVNLLAPFDVFYVCLHCPLPELERRERQRGDRRSGDARRDHALVNQFGLYDAELDGLLSADANAASLIVAWKARRSPGVFAARAAGQVE
jgi:chloramphenicol 3-O phosphotransferase